MRTTWPRTVPILATCLAGLALTPQACGGGDSTRNAPGSGGSAGRGGGGGNAGKGGAGGTISDAGEAGQGGAGALRCGSVRCSAVSVGDFTLPPCCPEGVTNQCGYEVSDAAALLGLDAGCVATNQPGVDDASCADVEGPSLPGAPATFAGCCSPAGVCGARVDLTDVLGVDFGCVEVSSFADAASPQSCGDAGAGGQGGAAGEGGLGSGGAGDAGAGGEGGAPTVCGGTSLGLVAHFLGEGNASDSSGRGHDALFVPGSGGALGFAAGQDGQAFSMLGDGHLETADAADLDVAVGVTLAAWIRSDAGAGEHRDIVGKDGEGYVEGIGSDFERQYLLIVSNLDRLRAHVGTPSGFKVLDGATSIPIGSWVHAAMTYDAETGELILYVNGTPDGSLVVSAGDRCVIDTPQPLRIGGGAPAPYDQLFFTGLIDDVRVYDRALSMAEIAALQ